jgi:glucosamine kinase
MKISASPCYLPPNFITPAPDATGTKYIESGKSCLVGVDGGGTKTLALTYDVANGRFGAGIAGPSNPESVGTATSVDSVHKAILNSLKAAGAKPKNVAEAVLSIAGITSDSDSRAFEHNFSDLNSVHATNDVVAAWASGTLCKEGVAIIAGTGSHTIGVNGKGAYCRAGGWGHIVGDEGAGYMIGLTGIRSALQSYDGRAEETSLVKRLLKFYGIKTPDEMLRVIYKENLSKDRISAFAAAMADEASKGDATAKRIFRNAGEELGRAAAAVAARLDICDKKFPVALIGSVFKSKEMIVPAIKSVLKKNAQGAKIVYPEIPPVAGALLLAIRSAGFWNSIELNQFKKEINSLVK